MVETSQYGQGGNPPSAWDILGGSSIPGVKFTYENPPGSGQHVDLPVGTNYVLEITKEPEARQAIDFNTKEPKTYKDGRPIWEVVLTGKLPAGTYTPLDEEDQGERRLYLNTSSLKRAMQDELKAKGVQKVGVGTVIRVTFTSYTPSKEPGGRASKNYSIEILRLAEWVSPQQQQVVQALQQPPAPQPADQWYTQPAPVQQFQQPPVQQFQQPPVAVQPAQQGYVPVPQPEVRPDGVPAAIQPSPEHVTKVQQLIALGYDLPTAVQAVAQQVAPTDPGFAGRLQDVVPF